MRVKTHQIRYFLALCEEHSFTRAARRCGVAQPSLTRAIRELENECAGQLFERNRSNVSLTGLGHHVKPDFVRVERALCDVARKVAEFQTQSKVMTSPQTRETFMRVAAVTFFAIAIMAMGLALRPSPSAVAAMTGQTNIQIDPYALQSTTEAKGLPQQTPASLF